MRLHILDRMLDRIGGDVDALDRDAGNHLDQVVQHKAFAAADIEQRGVGPKTEMLAQGRDHRLPEAWMIIEAAVTVAPIAVEEIAAELAGDAPVVLRLRLAALRNLAARAGVVDEQVHFAAHSPTSMDCVYTASAASSGRRKTDRPTRSSGRDPARAQWCRSTPARAGFSCCRAGRPHPSRAARPRSRRDPRNLRRAERRSSRP